MPFLLPPPDFKPGELTRMGLTGTCEMQICRSAGSWSMGTPNKTEHSIQNAYLKGSLDTNNDRVAVCHEEFSYTDVGTLRLH